MEEIDSKYVQGFNYGYLLVKFRSDLLINTVAIKQDNPFFKGMVDGRETFLRAQAQTRLNEIQKLKDPGHLDREHREP